VNDCLPAPYGNVTRLWTALSEDRRDLEARRLVGVALVEARIERPDELTAGHYQRLVEAARDGDTTAFAWLATSHRPLLLLRGQALFEDDPAEWGAAALELLHRTVQGANPCGRWLRRSISLRLSSRMTRITQAHLRQRRRERPLVEDHVIHLAASNPDPEPQPDLAADLIRLLGELDAATREALIAISDHTPITEVANRHHLTHAALRQRVVRARRQLQPALAGYRQPA
jgi:hypothetical protein